MSTLSSTAPTGGKGRKVVLFGPFVGEFGWELLYWQGWVRCACLTVFKDYHKVAAGFCGRYPIYTEVDEFLEHPPEIINQKVISSKGYATDNWFRGLVERGEHRDFEKTDRDLWEGSALVDTLLEHYERQFPGAMVLAPSRWIDLPELPPAFGTSIEKHGDGTFSLVNERLPLKYQVLEPLQPTDKGRAILKAVVPPEEELIAVFPRSRLTRRPDKNWPGEEYQRLISWLQKTYPQYTVAILGEPGGAYFADGDVPAGCLDLISVDSRSRMDVQLAALRQSRLAVGSMSGAFVMALGTGCPTLMWGYRHNRRVWFETNYNHTPLVFIPDDQAGLGRVCDHISAMLRKTSLRQSLSFAYFQWVDQAYGKMTDFTLNAIARALKALKT